jgi:peroxiredoxin
MGFMDKLLKMYTNYKSGKEVPASNLPGSFFDLSAKCSVPAKVYNFADLKGKLVLIVNVASLCGYTNSNNQFLAKLAKKHQEDLVVCCFPCGQFNSQEYEDSSKVCDSHMAGLKECKECFGKSVLIFEKVDVNGDSAHDAFKFLKSNSSLFDSKSGKVSPIPWNYCKFLVDRNGQVVNFFASGDMKEVEDAVEKLKTSN